MRFALTHMEVADPLAAVTAAAQCQRNKGGAGVVCVQQGLARQTVPHDVLRGTHVDIVVVILRVRKAQLLIGSSQIVLSADVGVDPVAAVAFGGVERRKRKAEAGQSQCVVVFQRRVRKEPVAVIERVGNVHQTQLAAEGEQVAAVLDCAAGD